MQCCSKLEASSLWRTVVTIQYYLSATCYFALVGASTVAINVSVCLSARMSQKTDCLFFLSLLRAEVQLTSGPQC